MLATRSFLLAAQAVEVPAKKVSPGGLETQRPSTDCHARVLFQ